MPRYITILYPIIYSLEDLNQLSEAIGGIDGILEWTIDLDDRDKVLRIVANMEVEEELTAQLQLFGIGFSELETFELQNLI